MHQLVGAVAGNLQQQVRRPHWRRFHMLVDRDCFNPLPANPPQALQSHGLPRHGRPFLDSRRAEVLDQIGEQPRDPGPLGSIAALSGLVVHP